MPIALEIDIKAREIRSPYGKLLFNFDDGHFSIMGIEISKRKRGQGIGTALVNVAEKLARELECVGIEVPATPSKMALSFWRKNGYECYLLEERVLTTKILECKASSKIFTSNSGIILMKKQVTLTSG